MSESAQLTSAEADDRLVRARPPHARLSGTALAVIGLAALAFTLSLVVQLHWFPHLSKDNDEAVYLYQASLYRDGHATLPVEALGRSFRPWMSGPVGDRQVMVFPPGWPAALAVGTTLLRSYHVVVALCAAATVLAVHLFFRELTGRRWVALGATAIVALSPLYVVLSGMVLSQIPALGLVCLSGACALRAVRTRQLRMLAAAGASTGMLFSMRPLDAVLTSVVFGGYALWHLRGDRRSLTRGLGAALLGALPVAVLVLAYNSVVTGNPLRFPLEANGGNNSFGFGKRRISLDAQWIDVTPRMMWGATRHNLEQYPSWTFGGLLVVALAIVGATTMWRRRRDTTVLLLAIVVIWPLAHFFYWGTYFVATGIKDYGPFYYVPLLLPAAIFAAEGLDALATRTHAGTAAAVVGCTALTFAALLPAPLARARKHTDAVAIEVNLVDELPGRSVVVLPESQDGPWILHVRGYFRNSPELDGRVVFAANAGGDDLALFDRFPDRRKYLLWGMMPSHRVGNHPRPRLDELQRVTGPSLSIEQSFSNPTGQPVVVAYVSTPYGLERCVVDRVSVTGASYKVRWTIGPDRTTAVDGCVEPLEPAFPIDTLRGFLSIGFTTGPDLEGDVDRYEYFTSMRSRPGMVEAIVPLVQRRQLPKGDGARYGRFNGQVDDVMHVDVTAG